MLSSYLIIDEKVAIVDCGPESVVDELIQRLDDCGIKPSDVDYLLLTHIHLDHAGGTSKFLERCSSAKAFVPDKGLKYMLNPEVLNASAKSVLGDRIFNSWGECKAVFREKIRGVQPHETISLGKIDLDYVPAPGHAPHQDILIDRRNSTVYSADALGILAEPRIIIPTTPPPSFNLEQALIDIQSIADESPKICCLAHFGEVFPSEEYFEDVAATYRKWEIIVSDYFSRNKLVGYNLQNCEEIFSILVKQFPEYLNLSEDLEEQVLRIDVGGFLNYYVRNRQAS